jgi:hypothetical protein
MNKFRITSLDFVFVFLHLSILSLIFLRHTNPEICGFCGLVYLGSFFVTMITYMSSDYERVMHMIDRMFIYGMLFLTEMTLYVIVMVVYTIVHNISA